jgi:hypothetical protein
MFQQDAAMVRDPVFVFLSAIPIITAPNGWGNEATHIMSTSSNKEEEGGRLYTLFLNTEWGRNVTGGGGGLLLSVNFCHTTHLPAVAATDHSIDWSGGWSGSGRSDLTKLNISLNKVMDKNVEKLRFRPIFSHFCP